MAAEVATSKKKGLFSRFRKKKKDKKAASSEPEKADEPTPPPSPLPEDSPRQSESKANKSVTKKGIPVITAGNPDDFTASDVRQTTPGQPVLTSKSTKKGKKKGPRPNSIILEKAPTARESAFSGPPRYDWIDVVSALAASRHRHGQSCCWSSGSKEDRCRYPFTSMFCHFESFL